jgi:hypothetical protein
MTKLTKIIQTNKKKKLVLIMLGLLFQYSQPNKSVDQFVADLAD